MSDGWKDTVARRPVLAALVALAGIGGVAYEASSLLSRHARSGAYGDLISLLPDRDDAVQVGRAVLIGNPAFREREVAQALRLKIGQQPLSSILNEDVAHGRVVETGGWVLPETLTELCALAAKAA